MIVEGSDFKVEITSTFLLSYSREIDTILKDSINTSVEFHAPLEEITIAILSGVVVFIIDKFFFPIYSKLIRDTLYIKSFLLPVILYQQLQFYFIIVIL